MTKFHMVPIDYIASVYTFTPNLVQSHGDVNPSIPYFDIVSCIHVTRKKNQCDFVLFPYHWWLVGSLQLLFLAFCTKILGGGSNLPNGNLSVCECSLSSEDTQTLPAVIDFRLNSFHSQVARMLKHHPHAHLRPCTCLGPRVTM